MMTQDEFGFLYFATENGLCRFDGVNFKTFTSPIMKDVDVLICRIGPKNRVWFLNLSGELFYLENEKIKRFEFENISKGKILDFHFHNNNLWIVGTYGILKSYNENLELFYENNFYNDRENTVSSLGCVNNNEIIFKKNGYLNKLNISNNNSDIINFQDTQTKFFTFDNYFLEKIFDNQFIAFARKENTPIYLINAKQSTLREINEIDLEKRYIVSLEIIDNNLWLLTNKGCSIFNKSFQLLNNQPYHNDQLLTDAFKDKEGNIWLTSHEHGIYKINSKEIKNYNSKNSRLASNEIYSIETIYNDKLILGLNNGRIQKFKNSVFEKSKKVKNESQRILNCIVYNDNIYLLGDGDMKVVNFKQNNETKYKSTLLCNNDLDNNCNRPYTLANIKSIIKAKSGSIWIGTGQYILHSTDNFKTIKSKLLSRTLDFETVNDTIYTATENGIFFIENDSLHTNKPYINITNYISDLEVGQNNTLWAATAGIGLLKIRDGKKTLLNKESGLTSNNIKTMHYDKSSQTLWVGTNNGLNKIKNNIITTLTVDDGLVSNQINAVHVHNDSVFVGTNNGLSVFHQDIENKNNVNPNIYFTNVQIWDSDTTILSKYDLKHIENNVNFTFNSISFKNPESITYEYKLNGIDNKWINSPINQVRYSNLPYGEYSFQVKAVNKDGITSKKPIEISIEINPPIYHRWWFRILSAVLVLLSAYFIIKQRFKTATKRAKQNEEINRKIAELKLQTLHAQMNPHFIFNSMNAIQNFISSNQQQIALNYLSKLSRLIRTIFEFSKKQTIPLEDEIDFLKNYISLEEMRFGNKAIGNIKIDDNLNINDFEISPMLIQPIVENAFKHGLFHKQEKGVVTIWFNKTLKGINIIVEDNGIGRAATKKINDNNYFNGKSSGLKITRERLKSLNDVLIKSSSLDIIDLVDENNNPKGTKVNMYLNYLI